MSHPNDNPVVLRAALEHAVREIERHNASASHRTGADVMAKLRRLSKRPAHEATEGPPGPSRIAVHPGRGGGLREMEPMRATFPFSGLPTQTADTRRAVDKCRPLLQALTLHERDCALTILVFHYGEPI